jgi:hypothetical protein
MPWCKQTFKARQNLPVAVYKHEAIGFLQGSKIRFGFFIGYMFERRPRGNRILHPETVFFLLNVKPGVGKQACAAGMIPMEVSEDNVPDRIGANIDAGENISRAVVSRKTRSRLALKPLWHRWRHLRQTAFYG